jgi:hypothetical protein
LSLPTPFIFLAVFFCVMFSGWFGGEHALWRHHLSMCRAKFRLPPCTVLSVAILRVHF